MPFEWNADMCDSQFTSDPSPDPEFTAPRETTIEGWHVIDGEGRAGPDADLDSFRRDNLWIVSDVHVGHDDTQRGWWRTALSIFLLLVLLIPLVLTIVTQLNH